MHRTGSPEHAVLRRRTLTFCLLVGTALVLNFHAGSAVAQPATPGPSQLLDLTRLFPDESELAAGLELEGAGTREEIAQLAGTFRDSRDAAQLLANWGWVENAYRSYSADAGAGSATPARVEMSLHQFSSSTGAAYALSYFAHDRAVALQHQEGLSEFLLPCEAMVTGDRSATRFLRSGNLVVRVTVVMPMPGDAAAGTKALTTATDIALAILANAGGPAPEGHVAC
jgi:hypothetical protein